ncbi:MAG: hypothetical protein B6A08_20210 [Sorangiineae bacterium NIC37A_2]|nr:MAG: hypothetical protein B6A08_20210 [Sorangiineae bacterium NIC37A_2]
MSEPVNQKRMVLMLVAAAALGGLLFLDREGWDNEVATVARRPPSATAVSPAPGGAAGTPGGLSTTRRSQSGNPLADLSPATLAATVEQPLFRRSRTPPVPPPPAKAPVVEDDTPPPPAKAEEPPPLELLGLAVEGNRRIALVKLKPKGELRRLRQGETLDGWTVHAIEDRRLVLERGDRQEVLELFAAKPL